MAQKTALVVGGGIAGILAARTLQHNGVGVEVVDKGRGVGGRMATRRIESDRFDHGAQFFTVRSPEFRTMVDEWLAIGIAREWSRGFHGVDGAEALDGYPRYCGCNGMKSIVKYLAQGLSIHDKTRVTTIDYVGDRWRVEADSGKVWHTDMLLLTPPVPQSLELLGAVSTKIDPAVFAALETIRYHKCLALMVRLGGASPLQPPGAMQPDREPIVWLADNGLKKISPEPGTLTIHAGPEFSEAYWSADEPTAISAMLAALPFALDTAPVMTRLHRWRFSQPVATHPERVVMEMSPGPLAFAGDAFGGARIEGAVLSGLAAADALLRV